MLEVCNELGFPVFVLERATLVLRDLDLIAEINHNTPSVMAFSIISTPDSMFYKQVHQIEHLAPLSEKRFTAMEKFASAGLLTGVCFMPILPGLCDDKNNLENVVRWTAKHGGKFVLASGLTLSDQQRDYFFKIISKRFPDFLPLYQSLYPHGNYSISGKEWQKTALYIRELCNHYGISDRIPRPILPGDKHTLNKRIVEALANQVYTLEVNTAPTQRIWAYRKAAWAIEDLDQDIGLVYRSLGLRGLQSIQNIGPSLGRVVEQFITRIPPPYL